MKLILTVLPVYFAQITNRGKSFEIRCLQIKCHRWTNNIGSLNTDNMIGGIDYKKKTLPSLSLTKKRQTKMEYEFILSVKGKWDDGGRILSFLKLQYIRDDNGAKTIIINNNKVEEIVKNKPPINRKRKKPSFLTKSDEGPNKRVKLTLNENLSYKEVFLQVIKHLRKEEGGYWWSEIIISHIEQDLEQDSCIFGYLLPLHLIPDYFQNCLIYAIDVRKWVECYSEEPPKGSTPGQIKDWKKRALNQKGLPKTPNKKWKSIKDHLKREIGLSSVLKESDLIIDLIQKEREKSLVRSFCDENDTNFFGLLELYEGLSNNN